MVMHHLLQDFESVSVEFGTLHIKGLTDIGYYNQSIRLLFPNLHQPCVKSVRIRIYSVRIRENTDQNNSKHRHFSHSEPCVLL